jgi:hypothetical protein
MVSVSALPETVNLKIYQGDDFVLKLMMINRDTGEATDLTGTVVTAQVRLTPADTAIVASFFASVTNNEIYLSLNSADTRTMTGPYVWDCQVVWPDTMVTTIAGGKLTVSDEVTR